MSPRSRAILVSAVVLSILAGACSDDSTNLSRNLDQQGAIDAVKRAILPMVLRPGDQYVCIRMDGSVAAGSTVVEAAPRMTFNVAEARTVSTVLVEESYLFYLDLSPNTFYAHDVKYIIIGKSGRYEVLNAQWWPMINGQPYPPFMRAIPDSQYVIAGNIALEAPGGSVMQFPPFNLATQLAEGFIVVHGLMPGDALFDEAQSTYVNMLNFFRAYANAFSEVPGLAHEQAGNVFAKIDTLAASGVRHITIAIVSHGTTDLVCLGGTGVTAEDFARELGAHPEVAFNFILCSCHSGSFLDNLRPLGNVLVAHTAGRGNESAWPDWDLAGGVVDYNPDDSGAEWTSSVLATANAIVTDGVKWGAIVAMASAASVPVTSMLLHEACLGAIGENSGLGFIQNLDLTARVGGETPQGYAAWEVPGRHGPGSSEHDDLPARRVPR